jgi:hypothetical protein
MSRTLQDAETRFGAGGDADPARALRPVERPGFVDHLLAIPPSPEAAQPRAGARPRTVAS